MTAQLDVRYGSVTVGRVAIDDRDQFCFAYDAAWLATSAAFPISLSLPLTSAETVGGAAHTFFSNLLPEGGARQAVCARLKISIANDFGLLEAIGGECAGALSLTKPGHAPATPKRFRYKELTDERLQALVSDHEPALLAGGTGTRLSLAGAQDKLPVALLDGRLHLPSGSAPSTHILKLPNARYPHLAANEAFSLGLARHLALDVVDADLYTRTNPASLLVARYDRIASETPWPVRRVHQEDVCQACALPPTRKYEQEGGPSLVRVAHLLREHMARPLVDIPRLLRWQAFNVVVGNCDGHAKNLSILYGDRGPELAPFYDILSTRQYAQLDRTLAMGIGGKRNPDEIGPAQWSALAVELGIAERTIRAIVGDVAQEAIDHLTSWKREFRERHGPVPILETLPTAIARRARRTLRALHA